MTSKLLLLLRNRRALIGAGALLLLSACLVLAGGLATGPGPRYVASLATATPLPTATPVPDTDGDGVLDPSDTCPGLANPAQHDLDGDGRGDACDLDLDGDDLSNVGDACPFDAGEACLGSEPITINLLNPAVLQDQSNAGIAYVGLTTFENPDPARPALLNGVIYPAAELPLWSSAGPLTVTLTFTPQTTPPTLPIAGGELGLSGGSLSLTCPVGQAGLCEGRLRLDLSSGGAALSQPPECAAGDARCAWSVNAAFGDPGLVNAWGAYDPAANELRFAAGLPAYLGDTLATRYALDVHLSDGAAASFESTLSGLELPYVLADGEADCLEPNEQPIDCLPAGDLRSITVAPQLVDGSPFLIVNIETGGELPTDRQQTFTFFDVDVILEDNGVPLRQIIQSFPERPGRWTIRGFQQGADGQFKPLARLPAGLAFTAEGAAATLTLPVIITPPWTSRLMFIRASIVGVQEPDRDDMIRDVFVDSAPLVVLAHGVGPAEGQAPLVGFSLHDSLEDDFFAFVFMPFPGSPLAGPTGGTRLAAPLAGDVSPPLPSVDCGNVQPTGATPVTNQILVWSKGICGQFQVTLGEMPFGSPNDPAIRTAPADPDAPRPSYDGRGPLDPPYVLVEPLEVVVVAEPTPSLFTSRDYILAAVAGLLGILGLIAVITGVRRGAGGGAPPPSEPPPSPDAGAPPEPSERTTTRYPRPPEPTEPGQEASEAKTVLHRRPSSPDNP